MGGSREDANIWRCFKNLYGVKRLWGKRPVWRNEYFWHDSFGVYFNRYIKCKFFNHKNIKDISDNRDYVDLHCFDCECKVDFPMLFFGTEPSSKPVDDGSKSFDSSLNVAQTIILSGNVMFESGGKMMTISELERSVQYLKITVFIFIFVFVLLKLYELL